MKSPIRLLISRLLLTLGVISSTQAFDLEAWKTQYGTALTPASFYSTRPGPWGDYFNSNSVDCANATFLYLGPLGIKARPYDQALSTATFAALYPPVIVDSQGLIQNSFGVMDAPEGAPADGKVYPGDIILEIEQQRIKTASDVTFPMTVRSKNTRGLEIHAGQLVDAAEGRGAVKLKLIRAALPAWTSTTLTAPSTSSEITVNLTGQDFVRLTTTSANSCLTNWINPRFENGSGGVLYLNAQTISQKCGFASPQMGKSATGATVYDGATAITNAIGTRNNSMIEYAIPAGYTTLKFKVQASGTGSILPSVLTRKASLTTTPAFPRQFDSNGAPVLPAELAPYLEEIEFSIPQIGSFGNGYDPNSDKVANYSAILAHRLAREQSADGSWPSAGGDYANAHFRTSLAGLGLLATGDPAYTTHIQKAATFVAANDPGGWAYPRGARLMFLSEYYLRTRDAAILPGLQQAIEDAQEMVLADFTSGHGLNVGYGGAGYIGATGTISTGLAIASLTPARVDLPKLDGILERIQELAGGNGGQLPYSRGGIGRTTFPDVPSAGQSYSCGAGGVLATKIRGGPRYITELFGKKFGATADHGDVDGGHASEALTFIMGSLACAIWGDDSHKANMDTFLWRLTLKRDFSGYINLNTNRLEYHGGDGGCHGGPTYDTGGYLILLNVHKHNLAITGKPQALAQSFPEIPPTYDVDRKLHMRVVSDWNMVESALGSKFPASLQPKLTELRSMPLGADLGTRVLAFLQREALAAATLVNGIADLTSPEKQSYCEMLLGNSHDITVKSLDNPVPTSGNSNYQFALNGSTAYTLWDSWGGPTLGSNPTPSTQMTGTVTLSDPSGTYLPSPVVLNFSSANLNPTTNFVAPVTQQVDLIATFNYTVGGSLNLSYTRNITVNPAVPFNTDSRAGDYTNVRKVWIPGNCPIPFVKWNMPVQLPSGITLPGASKNEGSIGFYTYDNGVLVTADSNYQARIAGKPCGYWVTSSDRWGECAVLGVNLLPGPVLTTTAISGINPTTANSGGSITSDSSWPITQRGVCWSTSPYPTIYDSKTLNGTATGTFTSTLTGLLPGKVYHVRAYATNAIGTSYGADLTFTTSGSSGIWTTNGGGSWPVTANWSGGIDASGADGTADFSTVSPASPATVTLDGNRSIGSLIFGNAGFSGNWTLNPGTAGSLSLEIGISGDPTIQVLGGSATLNTTLYGTDGLIKSGPGTLTLSAANAYTGTTTVSAGTLSLTGSLTAGSPVNVSSGASLTGTGTLKAATTIAGTLSPGISGIGTLTLNAPLTLSGTSSFEIQKTSATCDKVSGITSLTYGGTLNITNLAGTLAAGDKFTLFSANSYSGSFATLNLPSLTAGLKWDTSGLLVDGSIQVGFDASITSHPSNQSVGQGVQASFSVTATGLPSPSYQWQVSTNSGSTWTNIGGATAASYATPAAITADSGKQFRCVVYNSLSSVNSNAATLTVTSNALPSFTTQPVNCVIAAAGQAASFTASASGTPTPTYQWQVSTNSGSTWTNISGATNASYSFTAVAGDDNKAYRCIATNSQGSTNSTAAFLLIAPIPTWTNATGGSWPTTSNWFNNTIANGTGVTADFSRLSLPAPSTVTLDGARTIGNLKFGDTTNTHGWTLNTGSAGPLTLAVSSGTPTITVNTTTATLNLVLAGTAGLSKAGNGNLILNSANTYTGTTTLTAGQLTLNHSNALGGGALTITGGTLGNTSGANVTLAGNQAWNGNFTYAGPNPLTLTGAISLNANRTLTVQGGNLTVNGAISGAFSLTKNGSDTLTLTTGSTYSGGTTVNAGRIDCTAGGWYSARAIGTGALTVNAGATAYFSNAHGFGVDPGGRAATLNGGTLLFGAENAISSLNLTAGTISGGEIRVGSITIPVNASANPSTLATGINLAYGSPTFNVANGAAAIDLLVTGGIYGSNGITKSGAGFMKLSGIGSYSGTTSISAGTLQLAGGALGSGNVTIASSATLSGEGSIAGATTVNGQLIAGIDTNTGTLSFSSNLTFGSTSQTTLKLKKTGSTLSNDRLTGINTLTCAGTLTVTASGDPLAAGDTFQLFSATTTSGTFSTLTLPTLTAGLTWDTSRLYIDGTISLGKKPQTITFGALPTLTPGGAIALTASASSNLPVTYSSSNPAVALVQFGNDLLAIGTGTTTITASQSGDTAYSAAPNVSQSLVVSPTVPAVSTISPTLLTNSTASSGGSNIWDGGDAVTERGVCWSTSPDPTVANSRTLDGTGTGSFTSNITGLAGTTTYYIRAYAKNSIGYGYGGTVTLTTPATAITGVWTNLSGGSWPTTTNWQSSGVPTSLGSTANFATLNLSANRTVTLDSAVTLSGMTFGDTTPSHNWTLNSGTGGSLTLDTFSGAPTITVNNQTTTFGVPLAGNKGLIKAGTGTLSLAATATLTGGINVNAGTLQLKPADYANALPGSSTISINSGGTLSVGAINCIGNSPSITVNSGGTLNFTPYHCHLIGATLNGGSITGTGSGKYNSEDFALDADLTVGGTTPSTINIANGIGIGNRTFQVADATSSTAADLTLSGAGALRGSGTLTKTGSGTFAIQNANAHTGGLVVSTGTVLANNTTGSASGTGSVTVAAPATLGGTGTLSGAITVSGTIAPGNNNIGTLNAGSSITLGTDSAIEWEISNWTGSAGTGFDRLNADSLVISSTQTDPTIIRITEKTLTNFTETNATFTLVQTTSGITGFDAADFVIDTTAFPTGKGTWAVQQSGNNLVLAYTRGNTAPAFSSSTITLSGTQGTAINTSLSATDPEGDALTYSKLNGPSWLNIATNGALSGTPGNAQVGLNSFTVQVTDNLGASSTATLNLTVANLNDPPTFQSSTITGAAATQGVSYSGTLAGTASDIDVGDTLTFSKVNGPSWLNIAPNGTLSGIPANNHVGLNAFTVQVTDSNNSSVTATLNITVANVNDAPTFASNPIALNATEDTAFTGQLSASDIDVGDSLTFSKVNGPSWLSVSSTGALSGTPGNAEVGLNTFTVQVTDSNNSSVTATLNITVANVNDAPTFASNPIVLNATEDTAFTGQLSASDIDVGDSLTFSKVNGPSWLSVSSTGALSGTPGNAEVGLNTFTVQVTDSNSSSVTATLNITVANVNDAPTFASGTWSIPDANQGVAYTGSISGSATDIDAGDSLTYSKVSGPSWLGVQSDGTLSGTPGTGDSGAQSFTIRATDSGGLYAQATLTLNIIVSNPDANANGILDTWENIHFGNSNTGNNLAHEDADQDGLSNLLEYALGTNPTQSTTSPITLDRVAIGNASHLRLTIPKNPDATNLIYSVEVTDNLLTGPWTTAPTFIETENSTQLIVRDTQDIATHPHRFMRLKVRTATP